MKIQKYFGFISYNGKFFHGSQFQTSHHHTVQGCLKVNKSLKVYEYINNLNLEMYRGSVSEKHYRIFTQDGITDRRRCSCLQKLFRFFSKIR